MDDPPPDRLPFTGDEGPPLPLPLPLDAPAPAPADPFDGEAFVELEALRWPGFFVGDPAPAPAGLAAELPLFCADALEPPFAPFGADDFAAALRDAPSSMQSTRAVFGLDVHNSQVSFLLPMGTGTVFCRCYGLLAWVQAKQMNSILELYLRS